MFLLDTNIVSELRRRRPDPGVLDWFDGVRAENLYLSVLTLGEIRLGVENLRETDRTAAESLESWLSELIEGFADRIAPVDATVAERWGRINVPDRVPVIDGLLASTALVHDWTLVTRNVADVQRTGVRLLNPFS
jgi:predicted nucleic acid-binding protein